MRDRPIRSVRSEQWNVEYGNADPATYLRALDRVLRRATESATDAHDLAGAMEPAA